MNQSGGFGSRMPLEVTMIELIPVSKDGAYIEVHPTTVASHRAVGWRECAKQEQADPADTNGDGKLSIGEIREALTARGVEFDPKAKKAELLALLG